MPRIRALAGPVAPRLPQARPVRSAGRPSSRSPRVAAVTAGTGLCVNEAAAQPRRAAIAACESVRKGCRAAREPVSRKASAPLRRPNTGPCRGRCPANATDKRTPARPPAASGARVVPVGVVRPGRCLVGDVYGDGPRARVPVWSPASPPCPVPVPPWEACEARRSAVPSRGETRAARTLSSRGQHMNPGHVFSHPSVLSWLFVLAARLAAGAQQQQRPAAAAARWSGASRPFRRLPPGLIRRSRPCAAFCPATSARRAPCTPQ